MARDGHRIFDSDTHVGPDVRVLAGYLSEAGCVAARLTNRAAARATRRTPGGSASIVAGSVLPRPGGLLTSSRRYALPVSVLSRRKKNPSTILRSCAPACSAERRSVRGFGGKVSNTAPRTARDGEVQCSIAGRTGRSAQRIGDLG
jgi:hypothetical protein